MSGCELDLVAKVFCERAPFQLSPELKAAAFGRIRPVILIPYESEIVGLNQKEYHLLPPHIRCLMEHSSSVERFSENFDEKAKICLISFLGMH